MVSRALFFLIIFPSLVGAQVWDFAVPEKLSGNVNSEYEETYPLLAPDGKTLYFSRVLHPENHGGKFSGSDVWLSTYDPTKRTWSKATNEKGLYNGSGNNAVIGISSNGQTLYLMNTTAGKKSNGIYFSKKSGKSWSKPELIPIEGLEPLGFMGFYVSPDFDVIFVSMKALDSRGEEDLYVSIKNSSGQWTKPKNLGSSVNTKGFEISPFLSSDKKRLYFSSNGHKGFGDADIFYCDRLYNSWDTWSTPKNLGEKLNSKNFDAYFSMYGDSLAYFSSNRGGRYSDLYKVKMVPGDEVLAFGQRYLTSEEIGHVLGANVSRTISFESNQVELTAPQKELLFFIANKVDKIDEINFNITIKEEDDPSLSQERLEAVARHFRFTGIDNARLLLTNSERVKKANTKGCTIEILLYK